MLPFQRSTGGMLLHHVLNKIFSEFAAAPLLGQCLVTSTQLDQKRLSDHRQCHSTERVTARRPLNMALRRDESSVPAYIEGSWCVGACTRGARVLPVVEVTARFGLARSNVG
jgi:hypothetical protein